nr:3-isopropylmalate dehydratase small subunit [Acidimicrobium ferrooxidans]
MREWAGRMVPLGRSDVDTDQIIPSEWLKRISRTGFGEGLFSEWREDPTFVLNDPRMAGATILVARENFGVGSSREHAVWALTDYGFRVVVSPRFGDIFRQNATKNGLLPVVLDTAIVERLLEASASDPTIVARVDVVSGRFEVPELGLEASFALDPAVRHRFIHGLDDIGISLQHEAEIEAFEARRPSWLPRLEGSASA